MHSKRRNFLRKRNPQGFIYINNQDVIDDHRNQIKRIWESKDNPTLKEGKNGWKKKHEDLDNIS